MRRSQLLPALAIVVVAGIVLAACRGLGGSPPPTTAQEAARLVIAQESRFAGIAARDDNLIGQAAWYDVQASGEGWEVTVRIGWGDCPAGCISQHRWVYSVGRNGKVERSREDGDPLPGAPGISGIATAGPVCPVVTNPPDPACADRPVVGAVMVVTDLDGAEVARLVTDADGRFSTGLAPGAYRLVPQAVEGLMGTAAPIELRVEAEGPLADIQVSYDTGIR